MPLRKICFFMCLSVLVLVTACGGGDDGGSASSDSGGEAAVVDSATAGRVSGKVLFTGAAPEPEIIAMDAEPTCQAEHAEGPFAENVVVNDNGTLANVFVYVKSGLEDMTFPTPAEKVVLDQKGCRYQPHVLGMQVNQPLIIRNSDDVLHNIHPVPENSRGFNVGQPNQGMETEKTFAAAEIMIPVGCDVHGWMSAWIGVLDHPYFATTGNDGSFEISNLPPGDYVIEAWHEKFGTQTMEVTVGESESVDLEFSFSG